MYLSFVTYLKATPTASESTKQRNNTSPRLLCYREEWSLRVTVRGLESVPRVGKAVAASLWGSLGTVPPLGSCGARLQVLGRCLGAYSSTGWEGTEVEWPVKGRCGFFLWAGGEQWVVVCAQPNPHSGNSLRSNPEVCPETAKALRAGCPELVHTHTHSALDCVHTFWQHSDQRGRGPRGLPTGRAEDQGWTGACGLAPEARVAGVADSPGKNLVLCARDALSRGGTQGQRGPTPRGA